MRTISIAVLLSVLMSGCVDAVDSTSVHGILEQAASPVSRHVSLPAAAAIAKPEEAWFDRMRWQIPKRGGVYFPVTIDSGCTVDGFAIHVFRISWQQPMTATLIEADPASASTGLVSQVEAGPNDIGNVALTSPPVDHTARAGANLYLELWSDSIWGAAHVYAADLWYTCPMQ